MRKPSPPREYNPDPSVPKICSEGPPPHPGSPTRDVCRACTPPSPLARDLSSYSCSGADAKDRCSDLSLDTGGDAHRAAEGKRNGDTATATAAAEEVSAAATTIIKYRDVSVNDARDNDDVDSPRSDDSDASGEPRRFCCESNNNQPSDSESGGTPRFPRKFTNDKSNNATSTSCTTATSTNFGSSTIIDNSHFGRSTSTSTRTGTPQTPESHTTQSRSNTTSPAGNHPCVGTVTNSCGPHLGNVNNSTEQPQNIIINSDESAGVPSIPAGSTIVDSETQFDETGTSVVFSIFIACGGTPHVPEPEPAFSPLSPMAMSPALPLSVSGPMSPCTPTVFTPASPCTVGAPIPNDPLACIRQVLEVIELSFQQFHLLIVDQNCKPVCLNCWVAQAISQTAQAIKLQKLDWGETYVEKESQGVFWEAQAHLVNNQCSASVWSIVAPITGATTPIHWESYPIVDAQGELLASVYVGHCTICRECPSCSYARALLFHAADIATMLSRFLQNDS
ncbi:hypothetical protein Pelo_9152 [Pelomyxa schiedti]|nr:hypothetical protein Pelo_9152 [Pelomyxa schiedti]